MAKGEREREGEGWGGGEREGGREGGREREGERVREREMKMSKGEEHMGTGSAEITGVQSNGGS